MLNNEKSRRFMRQVRGFTLIELMVTLAVLAIVLGIAVPSFTSQIRNNQSLALGEEFTTALNFARSEAVKRGALVSVCASNNDGDDCGSDWTNGWLVFLDQAAGETEAAIAMGDPDDNVLRYWEPLNEQAFMTVKNGGTNRNFVRFTGMGTLARLSNDPITIQAGISDCTGEAARELNVGISGSVHSRRAACP